MRRVLPYLPLGVVGVLLVVGLVVAANRLHPSADQAADNPRPTVPPVLKGPDGPPPDDDKMARLAKEDPINFLEQCLRRYRREVRGDTCILQKQDRVDGKLQPTEIIDARYQEKPRCLYMEWQEGAGRADRVLYVEDEDKEKFQAHPTSSLARKLVGDVVKRDLDSPDGLKLQRFGLGQATERTLSTWQAAQKEEGKLPVKYLGEVRLKEANDRLCYKFHFTPATPQEKGVTDLTVYIDKDTWLQIGSVLKDKDGKLLGEYIFRDIRLNPTFKPEQFQKAALVP